MDDERTLADQARQGSKAAFSQLLRLHQARVRSFLGRYVRSRDVVDDLAREVFLNAYRSLGGYRGDAPFGIWLLSIARNRGLKYVRDESRRRTHEGTTLESALDAWLAERLESDPAATGGAHQRKLSALQACIKQLPPQSAALVEDFYFIGWNATEIAERTGKGKSAVWMTLLRLREALRECIRLRLADAGEKP